MLLIALLAGTFLRAQDLLEPWEDGHRGSCAALFGLMARNHLRYGLETTGGVGLLNYDRSDAEHFKYYTHHPQGTILLATLGASLGGTQSGLRLIFLPFAIGIVLLTYRIGRSRGRAFGAVAGSLAALTPLGVYYGAFVNFEVPTLFFLLLALHSFLRHHRRRRRKDAVRAILATAAAVYCDWIALGLPFCLAVLLPFLRRGSPARRRPSRKLLGGLFLAAIGAAGLAIVQMRLQTSRYGIAEDANPGYFISVTPLAKGFDWGVWSAAMTDHLRQLVGWPLVIVAAAGVLVLLARGIRRRFDTVDVAAATTLTIGLANVVILANHAAGHDFYLLYLLPALCLLAASVLPVGARRGEGRAAGPTPLARAATAAVIALCVVQVFHSARILEERRGNSLAELGAKIRTATAPGTIVFFAVDYFTLQVPVAADRHVDFAPDASSLERRKDRARKLGLAGRPAVLLIPRARSEPVDPAYIRYLDQVGTRRTEGPFVIYDLGEL